MVCTIYCRGSCRSLGWGGGISRNASGRSRSNQQNMKVARSHPAAAAAAVYRLDSHMHGATISTTVVHQTNNISHLLRFRRRGRA